MKFKPLQASIFTALFKNKSLKNELEKPGKSWKSTAWNNIEDKTNTAHNTSAGQGNHHISAEYKDENSLWLFRTTKKHVSYVYCSLLKESENII